MVIHQGVIAQTLGEGDGVMLIDESGVIKQGQDLVGVASQYCGSVGTVANSHVGVPLGSVSRTGYTLLDSWVCMPDEWCDEAHAERRKACGVPEDLIYHTTPELGLELLQAAVKRNAQLEHSLPCRGVAADELYGDSPAFRDGVAALDT